MNYIRHMTGFFIRLSEDPRMTSFHISLYLALFQIWNLNRFQNPFTIIRDEMMQLSRIGSVNTYARCMKQLDEWGYIGYVPASNLYISSRVTCISFDTSRSIAGDTARDTTRDTERDISYDTAADTARDTGRNTASDIGGDTASDTPSYYINITNFSKQETDKKKKNGRGKKPSGIRQNHVSKDKDYSEPL